MSIRERHYTSLVKQLLGPRKGATEEVDRDPRSEYVTGILEPSSYNREILIEDYGKSDLGTYTESREYEEDDADDSRDFETSPEKLDPRALPKSMGLSFVVASQTRPLIDFCVTWARYEEVHKKWYRKPENYIVTDFDVSSETRRSWHPSNGVTVILRSTLETPRSWHIHISLINDTRIGRYVKTHDLLFQPQIRVHLHADDDLLPVDRRTVAGPDEEQFDLLYQKLGCLARGHWCGAVWKEIDLERAANEGTTSSQFVPPDIQRLSEGDRSVFVNPSVRSEYLPSYTVDQSTVEFNDIFGMERKDADASLLAEKWQISDLSQALRKIPYAYDLWISKQKKLLENVPENYRKTAEKNLDQCSESLASIWEGLRLLENDDIRLAFLFMNNVMDTQSLWTRKEHLVWRPFQLAFILQCIPGLADICHKDREKCDLLWYPTGGGKTEAYLGLMIFILAYRRLRGSIQGLLPGGTAVISRYTLRLLTVQQFRRALNAVTAAEYLRTLNWHPGGPDQVPNRWGNFRFSIGLWVGGNVTPNRLVDLKGFDPIRKLSMRYVGAVGILRYSHKIQTRPGEHIVFQNEEPAQVLKCPSCSTLLSIPSIGILGNQHEIFWVIKADTKPDPKPNDLDYRGFRVIDVKVHRLPNKWHFVLQVKFSATSGEIKDEQIRDWWRQHLEKLLRAKLECSAASRPGYFIRQATNVSRSPVDFEIHCPNPSCVLNKYDWQEKVPSETGTESSFSPLEPFVVPEKPGFSRGIIIPAYTADAQIYQKCPSVIIATVDKFARVPFEPRAGSIFGNVNRYDTVWGYHRDVAPPDTGDAKPGKVFPIKPFMPPELIIQDELHLIEGPLGSMVGLYESAVDILSSWRSKCKVMPKYVASTATTRQASTQILSLYRRILRQFPPPGILASDNFFSSSKEGHPRDSRAGRMYVGMCAPGKGPQTPTVRIWASLLQESERIRRENAGKIDGDLIYYWTVVGYFNAIRELAAARSLYRQDIPEWINHMDGEANARAIEDLNLLELHSNKTSAEIPAILERLEKSNSEVDALMASSMFGTGVDIDTLSLMIVHGQPKTTASYIQATGRVGRKKGGLVVTFLRSTRPRDLDHYEFFTGYHRALHRYVEPVTVAPFSPRACDRALGPVAIALLRNGDHVNGTRINPDWAPESQYWKGAAGKSGSRIMASQRSAGELNAISDELDDRCLSQPKSRSRSKGTVKKEIDSTFDLWENVASAEPGLLYAEPVFNRLPSNAVVLGDAQHREYKKRVVCESTPQSMREVESITRFRG